MSILGLKQVVCILLFLFSSSIMEITPFVKRPGVGREGRPIKFRESIPGKSPWKRKGQYSTQIVCRNEKYVRPQIIVFWGRRHLRHLLAVNERRHGTIPYMPLDSFCLSVRDLHEIIVERLKIVHGDLLPFTAHIPSEEWIRFQFNPTNATTTRLMYRTSRFNGTIILHSIPPMDMCQWTCLISADDKHKVSIGDDVAVSTGVMKLSLTPSVKSLMIFLDHFMMVK
ncbi:hypothetical protein RhiirC2_791218 [Rhizophagus irregularis]|nr:hypothetical protein RhiirC2_791218 [Rhizophagus irregularis]